MVWVKRSYVWFVRKFGKINENEVDDVVIKLKDFNPIFKVPVWFMRNFVVANLMGKSSNKLIFFFLKDKGARSCFKAYMML